MRKASTTRLVRAGNRSASPLQSIVVAILIFGAAQRSIAAGATSGPLQPEERRFHYAFLPNPPLEAGKNKVVRSTVILRGRRELKLILDFGDSSGLTYVAHTDHDRCTIHERLDFSSSASAPRTLVIDGPLSDCSVAVAPESRVSLLVGTTTLMLDAEKWRLQGAPAVADELGPELAAILTGPIPRLSQVSPFIRILGARVAPLLVGAEETAATSPKPYLVKRAMDGCDFDARHGDPCAEIRQPTQ